MTTPFWKSVRELAEMWQQVPKERREMSGVESAIRADPRPSSADISSTRARDGAPPPESAGEPESD